MIRNSITKEEITHLPLLKFNGKIIVRNGDADLDGFLDTMYNAGMVGFDTETKPNFKKGQSNPVALLQFAVNGQAFIFRIHQTGMPKELADFLADPNVAKIGVALDDDFIALKRQIHFEQQNIIDLNKLAPELGIENIGVRNLSAIFLEGRISKNQQTSNWENPDLTKSQLVYAATDAWVCLKIYQKMQQLGMV
jgi:ribonuclease D